MGKARIIFADEDENYLLPLQLKFIEEFFNEIDLELITDREYFNSLFSSPQKVDILVINEELYTSDLKRHDINHIFVMMEQYTKGDTEELSVNKLSKYTNIKEIFNKILGKSPDVFKNGSTQKDTQVVLVYSACGGAGKTTVALGMCECLTTKNYKHVLYINADRLQHYQNNLKNKSNITSNEVYSFLNDADEQIYSKIKHVIRKETFNYLPPFKASLLSLGLPYSVYGKIILSVKASKDYDFIVVDADSTFDEEKANLFNIADKVVIVTKQNDNAVFATNVLVNNINGIDAEKYIFICNDFDSEQKNAIVSSDYTMKFDISRYIDHLAHFERLSCSDFSKAAGIQEVSVCII